MIRDALCSHYAILNVTPQLPLTLSNAVVIELYERREGIEGLHCMLHSDYIVRRELFL